jgi:uncharacterized protein YkwD
MRRIAVLSILVAIALLTVTSCTPTVSQQEHDRVRGDLEAAQSQVASLQSELAESEMVQAQNEQLAQLYGTAQTQFETVQARNTDLMAEYDELSQNYEAVESEHETLQAEFVELSAEFEELSTAYAELSEQIDVVTEPLAIEEDDLEQTLLDIINQERADNGLDELLWGKNIYKWATTNSVNMATNNRVEYSDFASWQATDWATGYGTVEEMAEATLVIWQGGRDYERYFLNIRAVYGAIGVHKEGEVFYITYIASFFE